MLKIRIKEEKVKISSHADLAERVIDMLIAAKALGDLARRVSHDLFKEDARSKVEKDMLNALTTMIMTEDERQMVDLLAEIFAIDEDDQN